MTRLEDVDGEALKACCAAAYGHDAVALILGPSYHPGGLELTRRLASALELRGGERVLDVASGPGTTALFLAEEFGVEVDGIDLSVDSVNRARSAAAEKGLGERVRFVEGDAERLPFPDESFDAVLCECALCTFPDKARAASELARVLRPRGRLGITDVTLDRTRLDPELASLAGWVACLADARPAADYAALLADAGLEVTASEPHDDALARMVEQIQGRLKALSMLPSLPVPFDVASALRHCGLAARAVASGVAGYHLLVARKG